MRLAIIKNSIVENVVAVVPETLADTTAFWQAKGYLCVQSDAAGPGDTYNNGQFEPPAPVPSAAASYEWYIDIGPFMDRFGGQKIPILASTDATVQAVVTDMMGRKWIDLQRADVGQVIDLLISKGFTLDKTAILTTPVGAHENLALRKLYFS